MTYRRLDFGLFNSTIAALAYPFLRKRSSPAVVMPLPSKHKRVVFDLAHRLRSVRPQHSVFADVALLIELQIRNDIVVQAIRDTKTGTATEFAFVGADDFYRQLAKTRYADVPRPPVREGMSMTSLIIADEMVHEALHMLFLAQALFGKDKSEHSFFSEEATVSWWNAVLLSSVYDWLTLNHLIAINHDFLFNEANAEPFQFWHKGSVFGSFLPQCPWLEALVNNLPRRAVYITERGDAPAFLAAARKVAAAEFIFRQPESNLRIPISSDVVSHA